VLVQSDKERSVPAKRDRNLRNRMLNVLTQSWSAA
jgi:hypothetical protein